VGRTQSARTTKYIEFHASVRLPHVYLPARSLHITERALQRLVAVIRCGSRGGSYGSWCKFKQVMSRSGSGDRQREGETGRLVQRRRRR